MVLLNILKICLKWMSKNNGAVQGFRIVEKLGKSDNFHGCMLTVEWVCLNVEFFMPGDSIGRVSFTICTNYSYILYLKIKSYVDYKVNGSIVHIHM